MADAEKGPSGTLKQDMYASQEQGSHDLKHGRHGNAAMQVDLLFKLPGYGHREKRLAEYAAG